MRIVVRSLLNYQKSYFFRAYFLGLVVSLPLKTLEAVGILWWSSLSWSNISTTGKHPEVYYIYIYIFLCSNIMVLNKYTGSIPFTYLFPSFKKIFHHFPRWKSNKAIENPPFTGDIPISMPIYTMWGPPVISWFINPINYSYKYHKP